MAKRWYIVHTYSGYENKVKTDLEHRIVTYGMENRITDIQIPVEEVTEVKEGGKRETKESKVFPGYVLVRMEMDDDTWTVVRNTAGVTGFVGLDGSKPSPLRRSEYNKLMGITSNIPSDNVPKRVSSDFEVGQSVKVTTGPLADFDGKICEIDADANKVKVMLPIFGRETLVDLALDQIASI